MYYNAYSVCDGMNISTNSKVITPHRVTPTPDGDFLLFLGKRCSPTTQPTRDDAQDGGAGSGCV